jgi:hypothetical protein
LSIDLVDTQPKIKSCRGESSRLRRPRLDGRSLDQDRRTP